MRVLKESESNMRVHWRLLIITRTHWTFYKEYTASVKILLMKKVVSRLEKLVLRLGNSEFAKSAAFTIVTLMS